MTALRHCSELIVEDLHRLPPGQTNCSSLADLQWTCRKNWGQRYSWFHLLSCIYFLFTLCVHWSTVEFSGQWCSSISDQPIPIQVVAFCCRLSSRAFLDLGLLSERGSMAFLCFEERPLGWPGKAINVCCTEPPAVPHQFSAVKCKKEVSLSPPSQETILQHRDFERVSLHHACNQGWNM